MNLSLSRVKIMKNEHDKKNQSKSAMKLNNIKTKYTSDLEMF